MPIPYSPSEPSALGPNLNTEARDASLLAAVIHDPARLAALHATGLLDSDFEEAFDRLTRLAVRLLCVPAAFISLVDAERDFYKSTCGFPGALASLREVTVPTFCHFTVRQTSPLVISDTAANPLHREVPRLRALPIGAYIGIPIVVSGQVIGAFCVIDTKPRAWTAEDVEVLEALGLAAQREIEVRGLLAFARGVKGNRGTAGVTTF